MTNTNRYEVTAPMPHFAHLLKGDILVPKHHALCDLCWGRDDEEDVTKWVTFCPDYPHLFRLLKWWEHVPVDELPKYVKVKSISPTGLYKVDKWVKSNSHIGEYYTVLHNGNANIQVWTVSCEPATESEYNEYINKLNSK